MLVMGNTASGPSISSSASVSCYSSSMPNTTPTSTNPSGSLFAAKGNWMKKSKFSCKIIFATMQKNGKAQPQFTEIKQTFVSLDEQSANVSCVTKLAKEKFGEEIIIVSGNGLPIEDESGTKG